MLAHENDDLYAVQVTYTVERTVYVHAGSDVAAAMLARDTDNWVDEDDPVMRYETIRETGAGVRA